MTIDDVDLTVAHAGYDAHDAHASVTVSLRAYGMFHINYTLADTTATSLMLIVSVCGVVLWQDVVPAAHAYSRFVHNLAIGKATSTLRNQPLQFGIVIVSNGHGEFMIVSSCSKHQLRVFRVEDDCSVVTQL